MTDFNGFLRNKKLINEFQFLASVFMSLKLIVLEKYCVFQFSPFVPFKNLLPSFSIQKSHISFFAYKEGAVGNILNFTD